MNKLFTYSKTRILSVDAGFKRYFWEKVDWNNRLIAITGARGVGKTTFLLQYIKETFWEELDKVLFVNADDLYFAKNSLVDFADDFVKQGGTHLFIDEIHKYRNWSQEVKNIYDYFSSLNVVITGSSALDIYSGNADLSRRAISYRMNGMSFREYLALQYKLDFPVYSLSDVLTNNHKISQEVLEKVKPLKAFKEYLQYGYYPYFMEGVSSFQEKLKQTVNQILESDLPSVQNIDYSSVNNLRKLLSILSEIVPYKPNISKLSMQIETSRETLVKYLYLLQKADLFKLLQTDVSGISKMNKPEKIYLNNTNLLYTLANVDTNEGTVRETFFYNQLSEVHQIVAAKKADFLVDAEYIFEVGGKSKKQKQIQGEQNAFLVLDNMEYAQGNKIPLWMFGFLY